MKMKLMWGIILNLFCLIGCEAQSELPEKMPEKVSFLFSEGGGMARSYTKISIANGVLEFEELTGNQRDPQKWSANISQTDSANLYQAFFRNKFDKIKNDKRQEIVYDAGSETISISVNLRSFNVTFGKNSPLSGKNLSRFEAVRKAFDELVKKAKNPPQDNSEKKTFAETETFLQGKWRAVGEHSSKHTWFLEWTFDNGKFKQVGYPPIMQEGKYKIVSVEKGKTILELFGQKGTFGETNSKTEILIDFQKETLKIGGLENFSRVVEQSQSVSN